MLCNFCSERPASFVIMFANFITQRRNARASCEICNMRWSRAVVTMEQHAWDVLTGAYIE